MNALSSQTFVLAGTATVREAAAIAAELQQALAAPGRLAIDCTSLTDVDLSVVQLLVATHRTAATAGKPLHLIAPTAGPLQALLRQAGFVSSDGRPLTPEGQFWINAEGKAA